MNVVKKRSVRQLLLIVLLFGAVSYNSLPLHIPSLGLRRTVAELKNRLVGSKNLVWNGPANSNSVANPKGKGSKLVSLLCSYDWIGLIGRASRIAGRVRAVQSGIRVDLTAGASRISSQPFASPGLTDSQSVQAVLGNVTLATSANYDNSVENYNNHLIVHNLGKTVVKRIPDVPLLGLLAMISIELINREASRQMETMPPIMRTITNTTLIELDKKIKKFSQYEWNLDPFLREEFENLQLQPIEKIDRFIVTDILPKVEKELTPILTRLIANPTTARQLTSGITDIISLLSFLSINNNINSNNKNRNSSSSSNSNHWNYWYNWYDTGRNSDGLNGNIGGDPMNDFNNYLLDSVEEVTVNLEKALNKWNEGVEEVKNLVKKDSVLGIKRSSTSIGSSTSAINSKSNTSKGNKNGGDSGAHSVSSDSSGRANSQHTAIIPTPISTADKNSALNNTSQINYRVSPTLTFKDWMKQKRNRTNTPH